MQRPDNTKFAHQFNRTLPELTTASLIYLCYLGGLYRILYRVIEDPETGQQRCPSNSESPSRQRYPATSRRLIQKSTKKQHFTSLVTNISGPWQGPKIFIQTSINSYHHPTILQHTTHLKSSTPSWRTFSQDTITKIHGMLRHPTLSLSTPDSTLSLNHRKMTRRYLFNWIRLENHLKWFLLHSTNWKIYVWTSEKSKKRPQNLVSWRHDDVI